MAISTNQQTKDFYPGDVPAKPGVYLFRNRFGKVIYVGKAANLRKRMSHYFQPSRSKTADPKLRSLINSISKWEFFVVKTENEALILESRLIKQYAPRYNVLMRDDKRFLLLKINLKEDFPRLMFARIHKDDACRYFGPFPKGTALRDTVLFLNRYFGLRSCKPTHPGEKDHKHCLASVVKDCTAPCVQKISRDEYHNIITKMLKILEGSISELVNELKTKMTEESSKLRFEKAAKWRDVITNLEEVFGERNRSFRFASIPSNTGIEAVEDLHKALGIKNAPVTIEGFDISNISGQMAVASMVCFKDGKPSKKDYRRFKIKGVHQIDDYAMMNEVIQRHYKRKLETNTPPPDLLMVDGGKGQLQSAIKALMEINFPLFPIIGLAKKQEEIFIPGKKDSLILDRHRPALRLLQALRDEAHRFAVSYHRELRSRRLKESLLDEIPGIGDNRKKALLTGFKSVREIRKATADEICKKVPGIGNKFAETILQHLKKH